MSEYHSETVKLLEELLTRLCDLAPEKQRYYVREWFRQMGTAETEINGIMKTENGPLITPEDIKPLMDYYKKMGGS